MAGSESGPTAGRGLEGLTSFTLDQLLPIDPQELADSKSLEEIQSRAIGQYSLVEGLKVQRDQLLGRIEFEEAQLTRYIEAIQLASDKNPGAKLPETED